jgi:hypothetical protein
MTILWHGIALLGAAMFVVTGWLPGVALTVIGIVAVYAQDEQRRGLGS